VTPGIILIEMAGTAMVGSNAVPGFVGRGDSAASCVEGSVVFRNSNAASPAVIRRRSAAAYQHPSRSMTVRQTQTSVCV
jgi:hypothetical protein